MNKPKTIKGFDALKMKEFIQRKMAAETRGMTRREEMAYHHRKALEGPFAYLARLQEIALNPAARVGEKPGKYR